MSRKKPPPVLERLERKLVQLDPGQRILDLLPRVRSSRWTSEERIAMYVVAAEDIHDRAALAGDAQTQMAALKLCTMILIAAKRAFFTPATGQDATSPLADEPDLSNTGMDELREIAGGPAQ